LQWWGLFFISYEISTPFLHARWFMLKAKKGETAGFKILEA
jgi:hypothetical protein